ncbi:MAG: helix-turn-helix transcriptional regulator [Rickettsiales bacterium]|jgi:DNA-binding HxlR family transcriptional regulator|nr:helix-turn-helix transcriptional regulator [Rickettsiales bacterium]
MMNRKITRRCPAELAIYMVGNKWKLLVLKDLSMGTRRFGELMRSVQGISQKVLTTALRSMEKDGLIERKAYAEAPPKVEYSLTEVARNLCPILDLLGDWGIKYGSQYGMDCVYDPTAAA